MLLKPIQVAAIVIISVLITVLFTALVVNAMYGSQAAVEGLFIVSGLGVVSLVLFCAYVGMEY